jgi:aspartate/methionine/tyrosine aminotransferase
MTAVGGAVWTTAAAPVQYAAIVAYNDDPDIDAYAADCTAIHGHITTYLYDALAELGVPCSKPGGGFYVYPSFAPWREALAEKHGIHTSAQLADFLLNRHFMASLPGSDFGVSGDELTLRLSTSYLHGFTDAEGWAMLETYRRHLSRDQFVKEACPAVIEVAQKFADIIHSLSK